MILKSSSLLPTLPSLSLRLFVPRGCSSSRSGTSRTHTDCCRLETAATSRPAGDSAAPPGTNVTPFSKPASRSTRPGSSRREPAPLGQAAQGSWEETPSRSATEDTMEEERMGLMDTLSFPSNTPGQ